ncbi:MAG: NTP transferase domain-containing protein [Oscillospiraceae bacterium]|nr:NTP transferase domain-containing protein [Oscillospiraceae bacterium]
MELSRYEFDLLAYIAENGPGRYPWRSLTDALSLSGSAVNRVRAALTERGLLEAIGDEMRVTPAGLEALEPYRVERAVIFAAGFGSRMAPVTLDTPKPLVQVNGVRIIDRLLDALIARDITDVTIVRGYRKADFDALLEKYPFLQFRDNDAYETENNISSALAAGEKIDNCYICAGDLLVTNPAVIHKYHYRTNYLASYAEETDDWCFTFENGFTGRYQKGGVYCFNQYEIAYWDREDSAKLRADFRRAYETEPEGKDLFWEFIPLVLYRDRYRVEIRPCAKSDIMEIDNFYELVELDPSYQNYRPRQPEVRK